MWQKKAIESGINENVEAIELALLSLEEDRKKQLLGVWKSIVVFC